MQEEKKKQGYSDARRRATLKYRQERGQIVLTMTKEEKERIQNAAKDSGQSVNKFILDIVFKGLQ